MPGKSAQFISILRKLSSTDIEKAFTGNFPALTLIKHQEMWLYVLS